MNKFLPSAVLLAATLFYASTAAAQGCVAIRQMGGCGSASGTSLLSKGEWQVGLNYRYFRSFRHFRGDVEQHERLAENTEVINWTHNVDVNVSYSFSPRLSVVAIVPFTFVDRSSLYEHGRTERHTTSSRGLADVRLSASYWLLDPARHRRGNIAAGLGIKLPTGNSYVKDEFYNQGAEKLTVVKAVDQSIQLGDGGTGFTAELQGFYQFHHSFGLYGNGFYLFNPQRQNETPTGNDRPTAQFHAIPDQFLARTGVSWVSSRLGLSATLGGRLEGVPVRDVFGSSDAYRRPGYVVSAEPGLSWQGRRTAAFVTVPYALYRNRTRSVDDIARGINATTGLPQHGDAAFADYTINLGVAYRFGGHRMAAEAPKWDDARK